MIYSCTAFAVGFGESREVQPLWLIGGFSALLAMRLGKFPNKLRHFPLANIRVAASIPFPTSSALAFSVAASSALRIGLASPVSSACRLGQGLTAQVVVQVFVPVVVLGEVPNTSGKLSCQFPIRFPPCLIIVKQTVYALILV